MLQPDRIVHVPLGDRAYDIAISAGGLDRAGALIGPHLDGGTVLVIADATVAARHGQRLLASLQGAGIAATLTTFSAGEASKTLATADRLWQDCAAAGIDRAGTIIALGGGVSGDLAGFVASAWMRGVAFVQIPTSLLAMVDSAVGGKTGVNSAAGKNLIGAFLQPRHVLIDPELVTTMDAREYRAGLGEVIKYGIIKDPEFLAWQEAHAAELGARDPAAVAHAVAESCRIKAWYVVEDEHEHGARAELNYGHTFGHALERETGYKELLHGEAVAIGMQMALDFTQRLGLLRTPELVTRQRQLLAACGLPLVHRCADPAAAAQRMTAATVLDKKARAGRTRFILPLQAGVMQRVEAPDPALVTAGFASGLVQS